MAVIFTHAGISGVEGKMVYGKILNLKNLVTLSPVFLLRKGRGETRLLINTPRSLRCKTVINKSRDAVPLNTIKHKKITGGLLFVISYKDECKDTAYGDIT